MEPTRAGTWPRAAHSCSLGLDAPEFFFSSLLFEFPAAIVGFSTLLALFVASAPLIKSRRESRAIVGSAPNEPPNPG